MAETMDGGAVAPDWRAGGDEELPPSEERCIWPGCTRRRAPGRVSGSGRQKEYCLQADPPENGGGPVHNARNRWAALRGARDGRAGSPGGAAGGQDRRPHQDAAPADGDTEPGGARGEQAGPRGRGTEGGEPAGYVRADLPYSSGTRRASDLLDRARRQHAATLAELRGELDLYQRIGEQLAAATDPAALDLEVATMAARAGRQIAQAEQDAADARRAQLAAERERDAAAAAAEQAGQDAEAAEQALAERTAQFERDRAEALDRAEQARAAARTAEETARAAAEMAEREIGQARQRAAGEVAAAGARAREQVELARQQASAARRQSDEAIADAARRVTETREEAERARADATRARDGAESARAEAAAARADADTARRQAAEAIADAARRVAEAGERERQGIADERERADAAIERARQAAESRISGALAATGAAVSRAETAEREAEALHSEIARLRDGHAAETGRLAAAHQAALEAERARVIRAEAELDALRAGGPRP